MDKLTVFFHNITFLSQMDDYDWHIFEGFPSAQPCLSNKEVGLNIKSYDYFWGLKTTDRMKLNTKTILCL